MQDDSNLRQPLSVLPLSTQVRGFKPLPKPSGFFRVKKSSALLPSEGK